MTGKAIHRILTDFPALSTLIDSRVYPLKRPQNKPLPAVTYQEISAAGDQFCAGSVSLIDTVRMQIDSYAKSYDELRQIDAQIRKALDMRYGIYEGVIIRMIRYESGRDLYEEDERIYHRSSDYIIQVENQI